MQYNLKNIARSKRELEADITLFTCEAGSKLESYLDNKIEKIFVLKIILQFFAKDLAKKKLYDPLNKAILVFNEELEEIFGAKAMITPDFTQTLIRKLKIVREGRDLRKASQIRPISSTENNIRENARQLYPLKYLVKRDLAFCLMIDPSNPILTLSEIVALVHEYINTNQDRLCSPKHKGIINCTNDALGSTFNVNYFHVLQIETLISRQVIFLQPRLHPDAYREE